MAVLRSATRATNAELREDVDALQVAVDAGAFVTAAASDETTAITTGVGKVTFRMVGARILTGVRASLSVAQTSGSTFTVDINKNGSTILSTKITIDNNQKTSVTAAVQAVLSTVVISDDDEIAIDVDQIGNGTAKGLKVSLIWG